MLVDFHKDILNDEKASIKELEIWRKASHHPRVQRITAFLAQKNRFVRNVVNCYNRHKGRTFKNLLKEFVDRNKITHIVLTAVTPFTTYITEMKKMDNLDVKIICFPPDFVFIRNTSIKNKDIDKYLCPSVECHNYMLKNGVDTKKIIDIPFPIQSSFFEAKNLTKKDARDLIGIDERFTVLYQIGGVGEGSIKLLELLSENDENVRVIILGDLQPNIQKKINDLQEGKLNFEIVAPGFVSNAGIYLRASDILLERSGANATTEALFLEVPVMTITLYDCGIPYSKFIKKNSIGYVTENPHKQYKLIKNMMSKPNILEEMKDNIRNLNLRFSADEAANRIAIYLQKNASIV